MKHKLIYFASLYGFSTVLYAGAVALPGVSGCSLGEGSLNECQWMPLSCTAPVKPQLSTIRDDATFRKAVDDYNNYIRQVNTYLNCAAAEVKSDIDDSFPNTLKKSYERIDAQMADSVSTLKNELYKNKYVEDHPELIPKPKK